jgi:hypothetical protein
MPVKLKLTISIVYISKNKPFVYTFLLQLLFSEMWAEWKDCELFIDKLLLIIPCTVDSLGRGSLAHVSLPSIHPFAVPSGRVLILIKAAL